MPRIENIQYYISNGGNTKWQYLSGKLETNDERNPLYTLSNHNEQAGVHSQPFPSFWKQ